MTGEKPVSATDWNDRDCPVPNCERHNWDPDEEFGHLLRDHCMPFHMANRIAALHEWSGSE